MKKYSFMKMFATLTLSIIFLAIMTFDSIAFEITGKVFEDQNCTGQRNGNEKGIGAVTVTLNPGNQTATTDNSGTYKFNQLSSGAYTVTETDPAGYCSTTPNSQNVLIVQKNAPNVNFGDLTTPVSPPAGCCQ